MKPLSAVGALVALVVVGSAFVWFALVGGEAPPPDDTPPRRGPSAGDGSGNGGKPEPRAAPRDPVRPPPPPPREEKIPPPPALSAEPEPGAGLAFPLAGFEQALAAIDWNRVGVAARSALEAAGAAARDIPRGIDPNARAIQVRQTSEALFAISQPVALATMRPGSGLRPESAVEHPAFTSNAIAAALRAFHRPLTDEQTAALRALTEKTLASPLEPPAVAPPDPANPPLAVPAEAGADEKIALEVWIARTAHRGEFRDGVSALLDDAQRRVIFPDPIRDRAGLDVFGPAFGWGLRLEPVPVPGEARWSEIALGRLLGPVGAEPKQIEGVRKSVETWFAARKQGPFLVREGELSRRGYPTLAECLEAARATAALVEHVSREGGLRPVQVARLRSLDVAFALERAE